MSYDHSSETAQLALPNPYRIQNLLLIVAGTLLIAGGVLALWWAREGLARSQPLGAVPAAVGVVLALAGLSAWIRAGRRLRFFFGRGRPRSLADELSVGATGTSKQADVLKEDLRQATIVYPEPSGAVDGLLYHLSPTLITAPVAVQDLARTQFFNLLALVAALASFLGAWVLTPNSTVLAWLSLAYALFSIVFLIRPIVGQGPSRMTTVWLVVLLVAAILAPVGVALVARQLPSLGGFTLERHVWVMLLGGLVAVGLVVVATLRHVSPPPKTQTSVEQLRLSLQAPPSALIDELDRYLQSTWTERIPSRRYLRVEPVIDPARHAAPFSGELLEETQPMPLPGSTAPSLLAALRSPRHRWLVVIDLFAFALTVAALWLALDFARGMRVATTWRDASLSNAGLAAVLMLLAVYAQQSAAFLWGRFDFESILTWVELSGTYQTSSLASGSVLSRMSSRSEVVRTESMTMRVWRARIESVVFGKDGERAITAMFSTDAEAKALAQHLAAFGQSQASFAAPSSEEDMQRLGRLSQAEALLRAADPAGPLESALATPPSVTRSSTGEARADHTQPLPTSAGCRGCGARLSSGMKFCSECGRPTAAA